MIHLASFVLGTISGVFLAQNYDLPDVKILGDKLVEYLNSIEKKEDKKK